MSDAFFSLTMLLRGERNEFYNAVLPQSLEALIILISNEDNR